MPEFPPPLPGLHHHLRNPWSLVTRVLVCWAVCTSCSRGRVQAGRLSLPGAPWGLGAVGWIADTVCRLLPWSAVRRPLAVKGLLAPDRPLLCSRPLSAGPRCEFSLGPRALPPRGPRTPGVPLHHQLYAGRAYHPHPHLHHLLHDSCSAPGVARQGRGGGQGWPAGWEGRTGQVRPVSAGRGRSPSPVPERLCGSRGLALLL